MFTLQAAVERQAAERGVKIEIAPEMPDAFGDKIRLRESLQNRTENVIKFSADQPNPTIELGWRDDGSGPVYYVQDNGKGIDPAYHDKIFGRREFR